jgi:predicted house-cleaning noncanonical NTP pyrophosphatase (MazG superfamily)
MKYNKLIRDKIPEIVKQKGKTPVTHIATDEEYKQKLYEKLKEETEEFLEKPSNEELSDILEVIESICKLNNINMEELEILRKKKAKERGSFNNHIILDEVK